ncbi:uncharacterized protein PFL1_01217 [Pseudozyma flocculosa PF-1]|uniref:Related to AGE2 - ADP-ribosylation factor and GTPase activating protein effector n=1 Tax=Pseudozyma flocculosa TaxID=84751 RepID=A0A5C3EXQ3_9BASI|nr:uncharacterized protein PFL1_01217 [Pseudozyma flocculosa PF-1]EPQ31028.1 hypothetical protein PFL1_01217 [Pseudozyma flocculosa PF-1]SPO35871.1 related to AGE2 - ADP-ribosylation factor and GTPase activating protein effector [Pseudozyma flocculosa]
MNSKATQERHQRMLVELSRQPGNDVCADCRGRAPRWASWNLGIFLCVQCAGVHRKMGTHISKVKSLTLDTWTREQVDKMKDMGNLKSNRIFNPDEVRNRPPTNIEESERDSELEKFIRAKYEYRKFIDAKPPPVPKKDATFLRLPSSSSPASSLRSPSSPVASSSSSISSLSQQQQQRNGISNGVSSGRRQMTGQDSMLGVPSDRLAKANSISRSRTAPIPSTWAEAQARARSTEPKPPPMPAGAASSAAAGTAASAAAATRSTITTASSSLGPPSAVPPRASSAIPSARSVPAQGAGQPTAQSSVFDDLVSLSGPSNGTSQPPPQMNPWSHLQAQQQQQPMFSSPAPQDPSANFWASGMGGSATSPFGGMQAQGLSATHLGATAFGARPPPPQHANTLPNFSLTLPDGQQQQQQQQQQSMFGAGVGGGIGGMGGFSPQQQQYRSASLGSMAFSPAAVGNPFSSPGGGGAGGMAPQQSGFLGAGGGGGGGGGGAGSFGGFAASPSASPSPGLATGMGMGMGMGMGIQQQQQQNGATSPFGTFASAMMPNQQGLYQTQQPQQQQQGQGQQYGQQMQMQGQSGQNGLYAVQAGQQAFGGGGMWG